jgi:4'-phosphopantetheinyl transferase
MDAPACSVYLAGLAQLRPGHRGLLDEREAERRARLWQHPDRDRFTLATALLRLAVAERTGAAPASVELDRSCERCGGQHGRPRLPGTGLAASISHSGDVVAVALTEGAPVGVDVEVIGAREYDSLVPSVCGQAERPFVRSAADFCAYWTRKEAVLKATGDGLRAPMTSVPVSEPRLAPALLGSDRPCWMADIDAGAGYAGAVAVLTPGPVGFAVRGAGSLLDAV